MERRVLLAISLSFLVLFIYQTFMSPARPPASSGTIGAPTAAPTPGEVPPPPGNLTSVAPTPPIPPLVGDVEARQVVIETDDVIAAFTNRGGRLESWRLKKYRNAAGEPMNLVPENSGQLQVLPFSLRVEDAPTTARLNESLYKVTQNDTTLVFDLEVADGLRVRKTFAITRDSYDILFTADVQQGGQTLNPIIDWGPGLDDDIARMPAGTFFSPNYQYPPQAILHPVGEGDPERTPAASLGQGFARDGEYIWAGIDDQYFISAIVRPPGPVHLEYRPAAIPGASEPSTVGNYASYSVRLSAPPANARFFFGPKELDELRAVDPEFTKAIYFGMFDWLAAPLLGALQWVHGFVGNWGWAIIVLTILINLAMFPLRHKSVVSMRKMQDLQPQMKAIQERYAKYKITDPEKTKMNQEVMELYKSKGVNPASGCIPMLLTMPFLFAFYSMLSQAIEIRGAEWILWIKDLAAADPYYVLPVLTGVTMMWQQKLTPAGVDPTQQKVMMLMPVMFTFIFLGQPSGLSLYWLVSQLWGIGQQYFTNYLIGPAKVHNVRPDQSSVSSPQSSLPKLRGSKKKSAKSTED